MLIVDIDSNIYDNGNLEYLTFDSNYQSNMFRTSNLDHFESR